MPRGKKKQASVGFCKKCGKIVVHFYINNIRKNGKAENYQKFAKKYCSKCKSRQELKIKKETKGK